MGRQLDGRPSQPRLQLGAGHPQKALTNRYPKGLPSSSPSVQPFVPSPRVIHRTTPLLTGRLFGDSSEHSQGILSAPTTKPTPDEDIQTSIASSHECQHLGITVPSMEYLSQGNQNTPEDILWSRLPMGAHYLMLHTRVAEAVDLHLGHIPIGRLP